MIGIRGSISAMLAACLCAAGLTGMEGPGPMLAADRLVAERAARSDVAVQALEDALAPAVEAARRGAARIVTGDEPPSEAFDAAADAVRSAEPAARAATAAIGALDAARRARRPETAAVGRVTAPDVLTSIAGQLEATGDAADTFVARRRAADEVVAGLERALAALAAEDLDAAEDATDMARQAHRQVAAWDSPPPSLPVWLETTGAMIDAMERIVMATRAGDADAAREAGRVIGTLEEDAETADRALRIAVSEGGSALASTALGRLAGELDAVASVRARVKGVLMEGAR
jgi:hypothetical protein